MDSIPFIVLSLLLIMAFVLLRKNIVYRHKNSTKKDDNDSQFGTSPSSGYILNEKDNHEFSTSNYTTNELNFFPFLDRIGYFLASNDGKNPIKYIPTSLQDTDPKDFA